MKTTLMSDPLITFLLTGLFWWLLLCGAHAVLLFGTDALLTAFRRRQQARQYKLQELARVDRQAEESVYRIRAAFAVAQRLIREDVAGSRVGRR